MDWDISTGWGNDKEDKEEILVVDKKHKRGRKTELFYRETKNVYRKAFSELTLIDLMKDEKFSDHVTKDVNGPLVRYYQGVEIRMVTKKHYFEIQ